VTSTSAEAQWKQINVKEAQEKLEAGNAIVIDVRMPFDYAGGRVPTSVNLPGESLRYRKQVVPEGKELLILSIDGSGSAAVCALALKLGYEGVYNIEGGMAAWEEAGFAIESISEGVASPPRPEEPKPETPAT